MNVMGELTQITKRNIDFTGLVFAGTISTRLTHLSGGRAKDASTKGFRVGEEVERTGRARGGRFGRTKFSGGSPCQSL